MFKRTLVALLAFTAASSLFAGRSAFKIDNFYSDHMVLQRDKPIRVTGEALPGQLVQASLNGASAVATTGKDGRFLLEFPAQPAGGPYQLSFARPSRVVFDDVMIGDVWFCSGQSNMQYYMKHGNSPFFQYPNADEEIQCARDTGLRVYYVPMVVDSAAPCTDFPGRPEWRRAIGEKAIGEFSAVAYFFGKELRQALEEKVAIGLVDSSWGGTMIEPWIPLAAWKAAGRTDIVEQDERNRALLETRRDGEFERQCAAALAKLEKWVNDVFLKAAPEATTAALKGWAAKDIDEKDWLCGKRDSMRGLATPGVAWYRYAFDLPDGWNGAKLQFHVDYVNDCDETYFDGVKIGATGVGYGAYWATERNYPVSVPEAGRHVVAIRAMSHYGSGAIGGKVFLKNIDSGEVIVAGGDGWLERVEFRYDDKKLGVRPLPPSDCRDLSLDCQTPMTLFNAMVAPAVGANIRGVIWYQGCSNFQLGKKYADLQKIQIDGWRAAWRDEKMPFLITQLSAYQAHRPNNRLEDDFWKALEPVDCVGYGPVRAGQDLCHTYPYTGVACTIDIGDHSDIHPWNKPEVARRLAHEALRISYGREDRVPGPRAVKAVRDGASVRVTFDYPADLAIDGDALNPHLAALAGADGVYHWAEGKLDGGTLVVTCEAVKEPVAVQYCFSGYPPDVNFRRTTDGLPVYPFDLAVVGK